METAISSDEQNKEQRIKFSGFDLKQIEPNKKDNSLPALHLFSGPELKENMTGENYKVGASSRQKVFSSGEKRKIPTRPFRAPSLIKLFMFGLWCSAKVADAGRGQSETNGVLSINDGQSYPAGCQHAGVKAGDWFVSVPRRYMEKGSAKLEISCPPSYKSPKIQEIMKKGSKIKEILEIFEKNPSKYILKTQITGEITTLLFKDESGTTRQVEEIEEELTSTEVGFSTIKNVLDIIKKNESTFTRSEIKNLIKVYVKDGLGAVEYLFENKIVHRDFGLKNMMLGTDKIIKAYDFDDSIVLNDRNNPNYSDLLCFLLSLVDLLEGLGENDESNPYYKIISQDFKNDMVMKRYNVSWEGLTNATDSFIKRTYGNLFKKLADVTITSEERENLKATCIKALSIKSKSETKANPSARKRDDL